MTISANYRVSMAKALEVANAIRSPEWRQAMERVPRELFVGDRFLRTVDPNGPRWKEVRRASLPVEEWLSLIYSDQTLVTQVGGAADELTGLPTSSSTMPSLVVRMMEDAGILDGHRVLEIGTGTGYSTALLCERLGAELVTSVEVDPDLAVRARQALEAVGYAPTLANSDGLDGFPAAGPYDRLIATCSVQAIPSAWLSQMRAGGNILTTLFGSLNAYGYVRLVVDDDGNAHGRFLPGTVSFMAAREHTPMPWTSIPRQEGDSRRTVIHPEILDDWTGRFVVQSALSEARYTCFFNQENPDKIVHLIGDASGSYAWLVEDQDGWVVTESGPVRLWERVERTVENWESAGRPAQETFTMSVSAEGRSQLHW